MWKERARVRCLDGCRFVLADWISPLHFIFCFPPLRNVEDSGADIEDNTTHTYIYTLPSYFLLSTIYIMNITSHVWAVHHHGKHVEAISVILASPAVMSSGVDVGVFYGLISSFSIVQCSRFGWANFLERSGDVFDMCMRDWLTKKGFFWHAKMNERTNERTHERS